MSGYTLSMAEVINYWKQHPDNGAKCYICGRNVTWADIEEASILFVDHVYACAKHPGVVDEYNTGLERAQADLRRRRYEAEKRKFIEDNTGILANEP